MRFLKKLIHKFLALFNLKISKLNYGFKSFPIVEADSDEIKLLEISSKYSMTSLLRRWALINAIKFIKNENIDGDFVECGVWKGGNLIIYNKLNDEYNLNKKIFAYDTFSGMSEPSIHDKNVNNVDAQREWENNKKTDKINLSFNCYSNLQEVKKNIIDNSSTRDPLKNLNFIEGKVEDTLKLQKNLPDKISILRLDTDWYESTKAELEILYPKLSKNGILLIDDYGHWKGARKAVDEFFNDKNVTKHYIDFSCRMIINTS